MARGANYGKRGGVIVENIEAIITREGDLVVAGTRGELLSWMPGHMNEAAIDAGDDRALVVVRWDDYMFVDSDQNKDPPEACTLSKHGFVWHTEVRNLRRLR